MSKQADLGFGEDERDITLKGHNEGGWIVREFNFSLSAFSCSVVFFFFFLTGLSSPVSRWSLRLEGNLVVVVDNLRIESMMRRLLTWIVDECFVMCLALSADAYCGC